MQAFLIFHISFNEIFISVHLLFNFFFMLANVWYRMLTVLHESANVKVYGVNLRYRKNDKKFYSYYNSARKFLVLIINFNINQQYKDAILSKVKKIVIFIPFIYNFILRTLFIIENNIVSVKSNIIKTNLVLLIYKFSSSFSICVRYSA